MNRINGDLPSMMKIAPEWLRRETEESGAPTETSIEVPMLWGYLEGATDAITETKCALLDDDILDALPDVVSDAVFEATGGEISRCWLDAITEEVVDAITETVLNTISATIARISVFDMLDQRASEEEEVQPT